MKKTEEDILKDLIDEIKNTKSKELTKEYKSGFLLDLNSTNNFEKMNVIDQYLFKISDVFGEPFEDFERECYHRLQDEGYNVELDEIMKIMEEIGLRDDFNQIFYDIIDSNKGVFYDVYKNYLLDFADTNDVALFKDLITDNPSFDASLRTRSFDEKEGVAFIFDNVKHNGNFLKALGESEKLKEHLPEDFEKIERTMSNVMNF